MSSLYQNAKDIFLAALERPAAERSAFVADACGTDSELRAKVESLLAFHSEDESGGTWNDSGAEARSTPDPGAPRAQFVPGVIFAGRYRMITRIGRGGMGDVWRADDLVLATPVALKFIHATGPEARDRIRNEVRLARKITHPVVCRVFDVGEDGDELFLSMELVPGEDLSMLLRRVGRLPSEKVMDIARQLCAGLAAAHAQDVLHRDLKPANILIDDDGHVRITDFGIAVTESLVDRHTPIGTPGYMAPEQLIPGAPLTERTDVYALGVVLFELLTGQPPFRMSMAGSQPPRPSLLVPDVDPALERVILAALASSPGERPASAAAMASSLSVELQPVAAVRAPARRWLVAATVVALAAVFALFFFTYSATPRHLTEQDTIVLADFVNTTGDVVFDGTLKVALAVALEQSPFIKVFPDDRLRETLRLMNRSPDAPVTRQTAREIAQREQLKALLGGSISALGRNYVLAVEALNAATGDVMAREQVEVASKEEVLTALGGAAARIREKLGESLASIQKFDAPLARATTPSLEALQAYSRALDQGTVNPRMEAIPHLRRALELDPDFALALALLSTVYANNGQGILAADFAAKAFALRDRVSERERFFVSFRYYRDATQDWEKALELTRLWTATYPREAFAFNSLGSALSRFGQYEASLEPFRRSIELDPRLAAPYANLAASLMSLNRFEEAKRVFRQAETAKADSNAIRRLSYLNAFLEGDADAMKRALDASVGVGQTNSAFGWQGHSLAFNGQIAAAHDAFRRGIELAAQGGFQEVAAQLAVENAEAHAVVGQCDAARPEVAAGLAMSRDNYTIERASRVLATCGAAGEVAALVRELAERFPDATLTARIAVPLTTAALAVQRGDARQAIDVLERVRPYDHGPRAEFWPAYLRGQAYLQMKDGPSAASEFQTIVDHRGESPNSSLYPLAHLGLARATALNGETEKSRRSYGEFLALWKDADALLQPMIAARQEYAHLQ